MADAHDNHGHHDHDHAETAAVASAGPTFGGHGQLIVGEGPIYLSHLPMFMFDPSSHPHNFQVILEVTFANGGTDPQTGYVEDRRRHAGEMYTLRPDDFNMVDLVAPEDGRPLLRAFRGLVVRGHFERRGVTLPDLIRVPIQVPFDQPPEPPANMTVNVAGVVYFQEFQRDADPLAELEYVLFGAGSQLFAAHVITRPPDFDQVLSVRLAGQGPSDDQLRQGVRVVVPGRSNDCASRLQSGEEATVAVRDGGAQPAEFRVEAIDELYLEEGELSREM